MSSDIKERLKPSAGKRYILTYEEMDPVVRCWCTVSRPYATAAEVRAMIPSLRVRRDVQRIEVIDTEKKK